MKIFLLILTACLTASLSFFSPTFTGGVAMAQQKQAVWIDVRAQKEFEQSHVKGAILIPHNKISKAIAKVVPDKKQPINLYCHSGRRAEIALRTLEQMGYTNVQNLGGLNELKAQGTPTVP